jgi:hypothetical protein
MALEIDLEAIQGSAKDLIEAQQIELNVALEAAGKPLIAVDGIIGPQTLQAIEDVAELDTGTGDTGTGDTGTGDDEPAAADDPSKPKIELLENESWVKAGDEWYIQVQVSKGEQVTFAVSELANMRESGYQSGETPAQRARRLALNEEKQKNITLELENDALRFVGEESSADILADLVQRYGLPSTITDFLTEQMIAGESELGIAQKIRARPEYAARFPGMAVRRELKLPTISESEYIGLERNYRTIMQAAGLPANFHDAPEDFTNLISGDVSAQEFQQRVGLAESALDTANQDIITQLKDFYDLSDGDLTAYYLDPKQAQNVFKQRRMYEAAGLSVAATQAIGEGLEVQTAEALQRENIQRREIQSRLGQRAGLTGDLLGSEGMSATDIAEAEFGLDVDEATRLRRLREARLAPMMGGGSALTTAKGITGLGAAE